MNFNMKRIGIGALALLIAGSVTVGTIANSYAHNSGGQARIEIRGGRGHGPSLTVIATALNMNESELRSALQAGKTVADVASEKGVALDTVINAIVTAETERINQAVTDGRLTQEQADAKIANLKEKLPKLLSSPMPAGKGGMGGRGDFGPGESINTIATALGISETDLHTALQSGQSVADVASQKGVTLDTVIDAIVAEQTTALTQAVTAGRLTQEQADAKLAQLKSNLPHLLALKGGMGPDGRGGHHGHGQGGFGRGGQHGQPSADANQTPQNQGNHAPALPRETVNA